MKYKNFNLKKKINVFLVGDFFLDEYIFGNIFRMSPEADIPIINISNSKKKNLGGAGNVLNNLYNLGAKITPLGIVGMDKNGKYILDYLKKKKLISI